MIRPKTAQAEPFPDSGRIAVLGDWGTGLYGAPVIAKSIRKDPDPFAMLLHLGDTYYSGTEGEVKQRFLDLWPQRTDAVNRAINSNHDMYSGGLRTSRTSFRSSDRRPATSHARTRTGRWSGSTSRTRTTTSTTSRSNG